jgi:hypothetical protein
MSRVERLNQAVEVAKKCVENASARGKTYAESYNVVQAFQDFFGVTKKTALDYYGVVSRRPEFESSQYGIKLREIKKQ